MTRGKQVAMAGLMVALLEIPAVTGLGVRTGQAEATDPRKTEAKRVRNFILSQGIPLDPNSTNDIPIPTNSPDDIPIDPAASPNRTKPPSLRIPDAPPDYRLEEANRLGQQGEKDYEAQQYQAAIRAWEQTLTLYRQLKDRRGEGQALSDLGRAYRSLSHYERAIGYYQQALPIFQSMQDRNSEADVLTNLGVAYYSLSQYERAINYYKNALSIFQAVQDRNGEALVLGNLGIVYDSLSHYERAIVYYQKALSIFQAVQDRNSEAKTLNNLGLVYDSFSQYKQAINYYQQALPIYQAVKDRDGEAKVLNNWGLALYKWGKIAEAEERLYAGIVMRESIRADLRNDQNKVSIFEGQASSYRILQRALITQGKVEQALEVSERGRARAFVELLAAKQATSNQSLSVKPLTIAEIKQIAKAQNATLVLYSLISDEKLGRSLYIWVIKPTGEIAFRQVPLTPDKSPPQTAQASSTPSNNRGDSPLDTLVTQTQIALRGQPDKNSSTRSNGSSSLVFSPDAASIRRQMRQLHRILIEPIADLLPTDPNDQVIFIPQGSLFFVPFPALRNTNSQYLIEQHTIRTAPSIQVLDLTRQQRQKLSTQPLIAKGTQALIVGNPTLDLPYAEDEAKTTATLFGTQPVLGTQATKPVIQQKMPKARLIHIAAHGQFNDQQGLGSLLKFAGTDPSTSYLTADEMLDMKLQAELVVLSACQSGLGKLTGDGVIGLSRSLISAGTPSVLVSLWSVPDDSTNLLMTEFYRQLQKTPNKAQALRQAMLTMKHQDPIDWAAFTLIGEAD